MKLKLLILTLLSISIISCEAPEGPQGEPGAKGEQGAKGDQGDQGPPGSANVTNVIGIWNENDVLCGNEDCTIGFVNFDATDITDSNVDQIAVQAYYNEAFGGNGWIALPLTYPTLQFTYAYDVGVVQIQFRSTDGTAITTNELLEGKVKFTLIPPSVSAKMKPLKDGAPKKPGLLFTDESTNDSLK